jgi:DNA-binding CsgD family transcriptional regulator/PAS domain-containing protein
MRPKKKLNRDAVVRDLIAQIYDASLDPSQWAGVAPAIAAAYNSPSTVLFLNSVQTGPLWLSNTQNLGAAARQSHADYFHKVDVWAHRAASIEKSRIFISPELISDSAFAETEFYRDWSRHVGAFRVLGSVFEIGDGAVAIFGIHRSMQDPAFGEDDKKALGQIFPHLRRAVQVRHRLDGRSIDGEASMLALDHLGLAVIVVDRQSRILYANRAALAVLKRGDALRAPFNKLGALTAARTTELEALIHGAARTAQGKEWNAGGALRLTRPGRLPVTVFVAPFCPARGGFASIAPAAILLVRDPELTTASSQVLRGLFGLTATEAAVAALLAEGRSIDEIAAAQSVSLNTARTHLKSILVKTGTNRQAELVSLLLQSVATVGRPEAVEP